MTTPAECRLAVAVPHLQSYSPYNGIGRVFHSLRTRWPAWVQVVNAELIAPRLPLLRNFPSGVRISQKADIVLLPKMSGAQALQNTQGIPGIVIVHDVGVVDSPADTANMNWLSARAALQSFYGLRYASAVVAISEFTRRRLIHFLPELAERTVVIHDGVNDSFRWYDCSQAEARHRVQARMDRPLGSPLAISVGSELPRKNIALLLRVFAQLRRRYPGAQLLKVGRAGAPRWRAQTLSLARELGLAIGSDIVLLEDIDDAALATCYRAADVFITTSLYEGFGLPALEALASGTPVVVSDRGALPEIVGDAGWVVEPTIDAFVAAVEEALSAERPAVAERGRARAAQFNWERAANGYLAVIADLAQHKRVGEMHYEHQ